MRTGTSADATLIPSASVNGDDARWIGHRRRIPVHGYKEHVETNQDAVLICGIELMTANEHDACELAVIRPNAPANTYCDNAYHGDRPKEPSVPGAVTRASCIAAGLVGRRRQAHNAEVRRVRCRIEKAFGTVRRSYGLRRMRWLGLANAGLLLRLTVITDNPPMPWSAPLVAKVA